MMKWISSRPFAFLSLLSFFLLFSIPSARGDDTVILTIILNHVNKGEFYIILRDNGDFFIKKDDLISMGLKELDETPYRIEEEEYILLSSLRGIGFELDEISLSLKITALPSYFSEQTIDLARARPDKVHYPKNTSAFLNYRLQYANEPSISRFINLTNELGIRKGEFFFYTDSNYLNTTTENRFIRLMTNLTYDYRKTLQRLIIGDFILNSGDFSSNLNMSGISFQKAYFTVPYLITHPLENVSGSITLPSKLDIYIDGNLFHSESLSPGKFDLLNIFPREGGGLMEIVLTDSTGRETLIQHPFYLTTSLLKKGVHDYSYSAGFLRKGFGIESFDYGDFALSGFHIYGINDFYTVGFSAESSDQKYNLRPSTTLRLWNAGVVNLTLATSQNDDRDNGIAGGLNYRYQTPIYNVQWSARGFSQNYSTILRNLSAKRTKFNTFIGMGYLARNVGTFGLSYLLVKNHDGSDLRTATFRYSRSLFQNIRMTAVFSRTDGSEKNNAFFISVSYSPTRTTTISTSFDQNEDTNTEIFQVQKNTPIGEGIGGRASYQRADSDSVSTNTLDAFLQYNARYGTLAGRYRTVNADQSYQLTAAGGVAYVGGTVSLGRPVTDSFGLVEVGGLEDVRVYLNNNEIGRTDSSGKIFIPNLASYYDNQISIEDRDVPIDYSFPDKKMFVSPLERGGAHIQFEVSKFRAIFGKIHVRVGSETKPLKSYELSMKVEEKDVTFETSSDGEFYLEDIYQGQYKASFIYNASLCSFDIIVPETDESLIDLGELFCEMAD